MNLNWVIAAAAPSGAGSPTYYTTIVLVVSGFAGALLLSMVLAPLWAARMVRPLNALIDRTHRIIDGDYSSPWPGRGSKLVLAAQKLSRCPSLRFTGNAALPVNDGDSLKPRRRRC